MVWPVTMHYEQSKESGEVTLTAQDYGANRYSEHGPHERTIMMRIYENAADALAALIKPDNGLSKAMWAVYSQSYEISNVTIYINGEFLSLDDTYCDDECINLVFDEQQIAKLTELFKFKEPDVFTVNVALQYSRSKVLELAKAATALLGDDELAPDDIIISEFSTYIAGSEKDVIPVECAVERCAHAGAFYAVNHS